MRIKTLQLAARAARLDESVEAAAERQPVGQSELSNGPFEGDTEGTTEDVRAAE